MAPVCTHCGHVVVLYRGRWIHDGTGWTICDVSARTTAEPYLSDLPKEG